MKPSLGCITARITARIIIYTCLTGAYLSAQTLSPIVPANLNYYSYSTQAPPTPPAPAFAQIAFPAQSAGAQDSVTSCSTYENLTYNHFTYSGGTWTGPATGPVYRYFTNYYSTIGNPGRDFPMSAWNGISFDASFDGQIATNTSPSTQTFIQSVFFHESQCYEYGNEFGFYKLLQNPGNAAENGTVYFYYSQNPNCYNVASLGSCRDKNTGASLVATTVSQAITAPGLNSHGTTNWIYRAWLTSPVNWRIRIIDPYSGADFMLPVNLAIDPAGFYAATATTMFTSGATGYVSAVEQRNAALGGITDSMTSPLKLTLYSLAQILTVGFLPANSMERAQGWCELGAQNVMTSNVKSTTLVQRSFPLCTVTVYDATTGLLATLYSTNTATPTPLANPFSADANGHWYFYAANGHYNVQTSGGGGAGSGGTGAGTVVSVTFPTAPSWLTASVANPTTTAAISLVPATGQTSHLVIGTCGSATTFAPCALQLSDLPGGGGVTPHNLLSVTHPDTTPSSPVRGGGIFAEGASPTWTQVAHGGSGSYFKWNGTDIVASTGAAAGTGACTNQVVTVENADAGPTCSTITSAFTDTSIAQTGVDINTSFQVTATHLSSALPINQGGSGTASTLTGIVRGGSPFTASELSGDCVTSGSNVTTCSGLVKINAANTGGASMTLDMSASVSLRVPNAAGASTTTAGALIYDTTSKNFHVGANGVDTLAGLLPSSISPANNDCVKWTVSGGVVTLNTAGSGCTGGIAGGTTNTMAKFTSSSSVGNSSITDNGTVVQSSEKLGIGISPARWLDVQVGTTANANNQIRVVGYQASFEAMNQAQTANWYFGVDDNDSNKLKIGGGYSAGQGLSPDIIIDSTHTVSVGNAPATQAAFQVGTGPAAWGGGDSLIWFRHEGTAANNEALMRLEHFSNQAGTAATPQPIFAFLSNRGTIASPNVALHANDSIGILSFRGNDGTAMSDTSAQVSAFANGTWSNTSHPSFINWYTTPSASITPVERMRMDSTGKIGQACAYNTAAPDAPVEIRNTTNCAATNTSPVNGTILHLSGADASPTAFTFDSFAATPQMVFRRRQGTNASPTGVLTFNILGQVQVLGYDGTADGIGGSVEVYAAQNWSVGSHGTAIQFEVIPNGTTVAITPWVMDQDGTLLGAAKHFANLGTPTNGRLVYCDDCTIANPCAGSGTGAFAKRLNSVWVCN